MFAKPRLVHQGSGPKTPTLADYDAGRGILKALRRLEELIDHEEAEVSLKACVALAAIGLKLPPRKTEDSPVARILRRAETVETKGEE